MQPILLLHIVAGTCAVLAGVGSLVFRKGGKAHRMAGVAFVISMICMAVTAAMVGADDPSNAGAAVLTIYLVLTAWVTARRRASKAGVVEIIGFAAGATMAGLGYWSAYLIATGAREAENPYILYASLVVNSAVAIAALGDLSVLLRGGITGAQRVARHLWRMCFALFIAVGSFSAQGVDALPAALPGPLILLVSMLLVLGAMAFWLIRVLFTKWHKPNVAADQFEAR